MKRRFIAGAQCPKCGAADRVVMLTTHDSEWIECIECNYSENRPSKLEVTEVAQVDEVGVIQFKPRR